MFTRRHLLTTGTAGLLLDFHGTLAEVAIYPRVLSAREIADNDRAGRAG
ncbi:hypothetical protein EI77_03919 [Prosthecobacter fusiformis]|uniref:Uncharacterized protein n=1 Tax=Prosthecobacter fusiformis TaxID=48464 RepID=A0A4R7RLF6_9BACT|nr:LamG domain-containing protein [Prosthecobacter fusiformis]TDU66180.1 hypothetical protein EI77_03919 [Prosthecobacter fusiformis]